MYARFWSLLRAHIHASTLKMYFVIPMSMLEDIIRLFLYFTYSYLNHKLIQTTTTKFVLVFFHYFTTYKRLFPLKSPFWVGLDMNTVDK